MLQLMELKSVRRNTQTKPPAAAAAAAEAVYEILTIPARFKQAGICTCIMA